jgi:hypothetical protein
MVYILNLVTMASVDIEVLLHYFEVYGFLYVVHFLHREKLI